MKHTRLMLLLTVLLGLLFVGPGLLAPWLAPDDPYAVDLLRAQEPPGAAAWLGRDDQGADILSRLLYGARISLMVGLGSVAVSAAVGVALGLVSGYRGGWVDTLLMRLTEVFMAFPGILLAIALVAVLGPGMGNVVLALSALGWTSFARLTRGQVLTVMERDYILAARAQGAGAWRIMLRHVLPNIAPPLLVQISFAVAAAILAESSLSFLGLGAPAGTPSWGAMLAQGKRVLWTAPHVSIMPGLAIMFVVLSFNLLGDALADWMDPKRRKD